MVSNKLYEVLRKHPKKDNPFDLSVGANYYKQGQTVSHKIFLQVYGDEVSAQRAIDDMLENKWIKGFSGKAQEEEPTIPADTGSESEIKKRGRSKK